MLYWWASGRGIKRRAVDKESRQSWVFCLPGDMDGEGIVIDVGVINEVVT